MVVRLGGPAAQLRCGKPERRTIGRMVAAVEPQKNLTTEADRAPHSMD